MNGDMNNYQNYNNNYNGGYNNNFNNYNNNNYNPQKTNTGFFRKFFRFISGLGIFAVFVFIIIFAMVNMNVIENPYEKKFENISLSQNEIHLKKRTNFQLSAEIFPKTARNSKITYVSDNPDVVTINSVTGYMETKKNGVATVKVYLENDNSIYDECIVVVSDNDYKAEQIVLNTNNINIQVGSSTNIVYRIKPPQTTVYLIEYSSSDDKIASVDSEGKVTGISNGSATITVKDKITGVKESVNVNVFKKDEIDKDDYNNNDTVNNSSQDEQDNNSNNNSNDGNVIKVVEPKKIEVDNKKISINVGGQQKIIAKVLPNNANKSVTWRINKPDIASIDNNGVVTGLSKGKAMVTVKTVNGIEEFIEVTVTDNYVSVLELKIDKKNLNNGKIKVGDTIDIHYNVSPSNATNKGVELTQDSDLLQINGTKITALKPGKTTLSITSKDNTDASDSFEFNIEKIDKVIEETGLELSKSSVEVFVNQSVNVKATITPPNATFQDIAWESDNPNIATVENGKITGKSIGSTNIKAISLNKKITKTVKVRVKEVPVTGVSLNLTKETLSIGGTITLIKQIAPSNASNQNVTWKSDNSMVASVDSSGKVTAVGVGKAKITVTTNNGKTATCTITVSNNNIKLTGIKIVKKVGPGTLSNKVLSVKQSELGDKEEIYLEVEYTPSNASNQKVEWEIIDYGSLSTDNAKVIGNGVIKISSSGTIKVRAKGSNNVNDTITINVIKDKFKVTYNDNNGKSIESKYYVKGSKVGSLRQAPTIQNYKFIGWYAENTKVSENTIVNNDMTLNPKYEATNNNGNGNNNNNDTNKKAIFNRERYILTTCGSKASGSCKKSETITVIDEKGDPINNSLLKSENPNIVTISSNTITAVGAGETTIYAEYNGTRIGSAKVKVYAGGISLYDNSTSQDYIVYEVNVLELGADPYGDSDSSDSIKEALNKVHNGEVTNCEMSSAKGGTVFVPAGLYQVSKAVNVSCNEGLIGELKEGTAEGTVLLMMNTSARIYTNMNSAVKNIAFYLPNQSGTYSSHGTIQNGGSGGADVNIENVYFVNSNIGLNFSGNANHFGPSAILFFRNIYGAPDTGIVNDNNLDTIRLENISFKKDYHAKGIAAINKMYKSSHPNVSSKYPSGSISAKVGINLKRVDWYYLANIDIQGYGQAISLTKSSEGNSEGSCFDCRGSNFTVQSARHGILSYANFTNYQNDDSSNTAQVSISHSNISNNLTVSSNKIPASASRVKVGNYNVQYPPRIMDNTSSSVSDYKDSSITSGYDAVKKVKKVKPKANLIIATSIGELQSKLNSASSSGGGVVYLVSGNYTLSGTINIPSNVELRGATPWLHDVNFAGLTRIKADGKNAFTMQSNSMMNGIAIVYENDESKTAITGKGANISIINTDIHAAGVGIDFASSRCDNHYVDKLFGVFFGSGIKVGSGSQNGIIRDVHMHTNQLGGASTAKGKRSWQKETAFDIGSSSGEKLFNNFVWGSNIGMKFNNATNFFALQNGIDMANTYSTQIMGSSSGKYINNMLVSNPGNCQNSRYVHANNSGAIRYVNNMFWGNEMCNTLIELHGSGSHTFYGGIINEHNSSSVKNVFYTDANSLDINAMIINEQTNSIVNARGGTVKLQNTLCGNAICTENNIVR